MPQPRYGCGKIPCIPDHRSTTLGTGVSTAGDPATLTNFCRVRPSRLKTLSRIITSTHLLAVLVKSTEMGLGVEAVPSGDTSSVTGVLVSRPLADLTVITAPTLVTPSGA